MANLYLPEIIKSFVEKGITNFVVIYPVYIGGMAANAKKIGVSLPAAGGYFIKAVEVMEKAGLSGPIIGREANLNAALALGLADPGETDTNAMLKAIQVYDSLSKNHSVQIATLTGSAKLGYAADEAISGQLDRLLSQFPCESCIFVSDGAADEQIMPVIRSRLKIDGGVITMYDSRTRLAQDVVQQHVGSARPYQRSCGLCVARCARQPRAVLRRHLVLRWLWTDF